MSILIGILVILGIIFGIIVLGLTIISIYLIVCLIRGVVIGIKKEEEYQEKLSKMIDDL
jgi:hypothetical protein